MTTYTTTAALTFETFSLTLSVSKTTFTADVTAPVYNSIEGATAVTIKAAGYNPDETPLRLEIQLSESADFGTILDSATYASVATGAEQTWNVSGLANTRRYYVRARSGRVDQSGFSAWDTSTFTVDVRQKDGTCYFYANVGANPSATDKGASYFYSNVGFTLTPGRNAAHYGYVNVGVQASSPWTAAYYLYANYTTDVPTPHIWFIEPTSGSVGDGFVIYGTGFGDLPETYNGDVYFAVPGGGEINLPITSWQTFPATTYAATSSRMIDNTAMRQDDYYTTFTPSSSTLGDGWFYYGATTPWSCYDGQAVPSSTSTNMFAVRQTLSADGTISTYVTEYTNAAGIVFRFANTSNYWVWRPYNRILTKVVSGTTTNYTSIGSGTPAVGAKCTVFLSGTTITLRVNNVDYYTTSSTDNQSYTMHGMYATRSANRFASFEYTSALPMSYPADPTHTEIQVLVPPGSVTPGYNVYVRTDI